MANYFNILGPVMLLLFSLQLGHALDCYVCTNQANNTVKCLTTIKTCEQGQDVCLTEIKWGSTPYWSRGAKKQYYISKRCSTKRECETIRRQNMPDCTRIWYQDWQCSECCQGDKCNSYLISSAPQAHASWYPALSLAILANILTIFYGIKS